MVGKKFLLIFFIGISFAFAHKIAGVTMQLKKVNDNQVLIQVFSKKSKRSLVGNEVRLISMFDNRILDSGKLTNTGLQMKIPTESYWVYVLVRDNDIVGDGPAPKEGFLKVKEIKKVAFLYMSLLSLGFLLLSFSIVYFKLKRFKRGVKEGSQ